MQSPVTPFYPITIDQKATRFALDCLAGIQACGIFYNPYQDPRNPSVPGYARWALELFHPLSFELGLLPDLRIDWDLPSVMPTIVERFDLNAQGELIHFLETFLTVLQMMLPSGEWTGAHGVD